MKYVSYDMNAYNLHIINTDKFKTVTISVNFRRKVNKEEITIRNLLKDLMINSTESYPSEKKLIMATEDLYDLKLSSENYRLGNYAIMSFKTRFLNEKYTEDGMNEESIKFLLDLIFRPKFDNDLVKCKGMIEKSILSLRDNKIKYSLFKLLETTGNMSYSYNSYGYLEDLEKIDVNDITEYYNSVIRNDIIDVYDVGTKENLEEIKIYYQYLNQVSYELYFYDKQRMAYLKKITSLSPDEKEKMIQEMSQTTDDIYQDDD